MTFVFGGCRCLVKLSFLTLKVPESHGSRPAKSQASRVRLTHFRWISRSHSAQWKSHAFSCSTKNNIFNVTSVYSSMVNDCASVNSFLAAHRHNLRSVALCPFSIRGVGNTDIVYVRVVKMRSVATHVAWSVCLLVTTVSHRRELLLGPGAQAPYFYDHGARLYDELPPHCDVIIVYIVFQLFALVLRNADKSTVRAFISCSARHFWKTAKFAGSVGHPMIKMFSASGGFAPWPPVQGLCPSTPLLSLVISCNGGRSGLTHFHFWTLAGLRIRRVNDNLQLPKSVVGRVWDREQTIGALLGE